MGVWTLGREAAQLPAASSPPNAVQLGAANPQPASDEKATFADIAGRLLTWIPSDIIALYSAAVTALVVAPGDDAALWLTIGGGVLALLFVPLAAWSNSADSGLRSKKTLLRAVMATGAFAIWSATVPNSGWNRLSWLAEDPARTAVIFGAAGLVFSLIASGIDKRVAS